MKVHTSYEDRLTVGSNRIYYIRRCGKQFRTSSWEQTAARKNDPIAEIGSEILAWHSSTFLPLSAMGSFFLAAHKHAKMIK